MLMVVGGWLLLLGCVESIQALLQALTALLRVLEKETGETGIASEKSG